MFYKYIYFVFTLVHFYNSGVETKLFKMDAIKKKMQAMKMEKDSAMDKADTCEGQAKDANLRADKVTFIHLFIYKFLNQKRH